MPTQSIPIFDPAHGVRRNDRARRAVQPKNIFQSPKQQRHHGSTKRTNFAMSTNPYYFRNKTQNTQHFKWWPSFFQNNNMSMSSFNNIRAKEIFIRIVIICTMTLTIIGITDVAKSHLSIFNTHTLDPVYMDKEKEVLEMLSSLQWKWPVSVRNEEDFFEPILHPADTNVRLNVPRFFIKGPLAGGEGKLMTPLIASRIGTSSQLNSKKTSILDKRTIFISIVSYRDLQCRFTVESIFQRAKYPDRIRVAVVDQIEFGVDPSCDFPVQPCGENRDQTLCNYRDRIDVYELDAALAVGPLFARHIVHRMYRGEYYALQIDSHVTFVQDWDTNIVSQWESTNNEMAIISTILSDSIGSINEDTGAATKTSRHILCNSDFKPSSIFSLLQHKNPPELHSTGEDVTPILETYWSASFSFSRGHFVINVPYDPYVPMVFQGEEISIGLRGFTHGYDYYAPEKNVAFHTSYESAQDAQKNFWERTNSYRSLEKKALMRMLGIIEMIPTINTAMWSHREEERYGLGKVRSPSKFFQCFGIHVQVKRTEHKLCYFVESGQMHDLFTKQLRPDGMGIDYSNIHYRFHEKSMKD